MLWTPFSFPTSFCPLTFQLCLAIVPWLCFAGVGGLCSDGKMDLCHTLELVRSGTDTAVVPDVRHSGTAERYRRAGAYGFVR